ncbi:uncharacterized protein LOC114336048 isoform X1 [Diabrotica virgifera virgifera]|uniref:Uncharacterized protein LOC114336048 isoform X1 n=1 Tax=Diabrotica virgifera virgifera TaxID=50390 RepID=A0A6P7G030_DIAVI|nr:uncharacterized protein LOC114336048 isoform X1 [Diabrotica virgifera virgifera]
MQVDYYNGYLDVKIPSKSKRGFTPWKTWKKQWCEINRLDSIENGIELKLRSCKEGNILNCFILPRSSTICRTESRTKQYAFGVFNLGRKQKPLIFLNGSSETQTQEWMLTLRRMLAVASYIPVDNSNFRVSLVDNHHSRAAGLLGTFGVLSINQQELSINDPCTGEAKITWKWFQFHQFHLQAPLQPEDDRRVIVMHTSSEFPAGPGLILLYCKQASSLLHHLVSRGHFPKTKNRLSRSEGDLVNAFNNSFHAESPVCLRSQTGSEDSGIRASIVSDDSEYVAKCKDASNYVSMGMDEVTKTPGGSETEDSSLDLVGTTPKSNIPRNESGISLASGIYEEIPDDYERKTTSHSKHTSHVYENPADVIVELRKSFFTPPPLPPRSLDFTWINRTRINSENNTLQNPLVPSLKPRANTMPAQDLSKISKIFTAESDYVVMSPSKTQDTAKKPEVENFYMPMLPLKYLKFKTDNITVDLKKT